MREIKFRAWDLDEKEDCRVLAIRWDVTGGIQIGLPIKDGIGLRWLHISRVKLREFTGLKDKNGKEIFEGDIIQRLVKDDGREYIQTFEIVWNDEDAEFSPRAKNGWEPCIGPVHKDSEIIGNIYENPELLEDKS